MKKILLMLTMVLVLGFSAICSASNGKVLDAEEAMVNKFLASFQLFCRNFHDD